MLTRARLQELIERFSTRRIAVLGDFFLDKYLEVDPSLAEISVETGKTAHQVIAARSAPGAAGTVVNNLVSLSGAPIAVLGVVGDDGEGWALRQELARRGCDVSGLLTARDIMTPTYLKPRDVGVSGLPGEHSRYDTKNRRPMPDVVVQELIARLSRLLPELDAVIVADQVEAEDCGVVTRTLRDAVSCLARENPRVVFWADSRRRIHLFRDVCIKPNQFEAMQHDHPLPDEVIELSALQQRMPVLRSQNGAPVVITRGAEGAVVSDPETIFVPTLRLSGPLDTTGAGDSVTAGSVRPLAAGATLPEATLIGMLTASVTVQQLGTTGVATPDDLIRQLSAWRIQQGETPEASPNP